MKLKFSSQQLRMARRKLQKGLTLLELVVVLTILAALGGILLPMLPNLLTKAHVAVCTTNIPEMNKAVITYSTTALTQPSRFDNLADGAAIWDGMPFATTGAANFAPGAFAGDEADSLDAAGITDLVEPTGAPAAGTANPTFEAHNTASTMATPATVVATTAATNVLWITDAHAEDVLGLEPAPGGEWRYAAFGIGQASTLVGANSGIFEAPVHFSEADGGNPNQVYGRYIVVYRVFANGDPAEFAGATAPHENGLENVNGHIKDFY